MKRQYFNGDTNYSIFHEADEDHQRSLEVIDSAIEELQKVRALIERRNKDEINAIDPFYYVIQVQTPNLDGKGILESGFGHPLPVAIATLSRYEASPLLHSMMRTILGKSVSEIFTGEE